MTVDQQILADLDRWVDDRLRQLLRDAADRYEVCGLLEHEVIPRITPSLALALAYVLAQSPATPQQCGEMLAESVWWLRQDQSKRAKEQ